MARVSKADILAKRAKADSQPATPKKTSTFRIPSLHHRSNQRPSTSHRPLALAGDVIFTQPHNIAAQQSRTSRTAAVNASSHSSTALGLDSLNDHESSGGLEQQPSRHRAKRQRQSWRWINDVIPSLVRPNLKLRQNTQSYRSPPTLPAPPPCACTRSRTISVALVSLKSIERASFRTCDCRSAAVQLMERGMFPCAPFAPSLAVDIDLLELVGRMSVRVAPNVTAWCSALEDHLSMKGFKLHSVDTLRRRFGNAIQWYSTLQHATDAFLDSIIHQARSILVDESNPLPTSSSSVDSSSAPIVNLNSSPATTGQSASRKRRRDSDASSKHPFPNLPLPLQRPTEYLRARCPLCFGGSSRIDPAAGPDSFVCIDACFTQQGMEDDQRDPLRQHPRTIWLEEGKVKGMDEYVESVRGSKGKPRLKKQKTSTNASTTQPDGFEGPLQVPTSVLDGCESGFTAANEARIKGSTRHKGSTAIMAILCRHDRPLWLANMTSAGEKQHYALALVETLFQHLPLDWRIGLLYDIACQLHRSCIKWGFFARFLDRITFAISVFHAYGHQWPCQLIYHPRKRTGFGLTDGEGCERFWHSISKLIAYLRVTGHHLRLYTIDMQVQHADKESLQNLGSWLARRTAHSKAKATEAAAILQSFYESRLGDSDDAAAVSKARAVAIDALRTQWALQIAAQTGPAPSQSKNRGKTAVEEVMTLRNSRNRLNVRISRLEELVLDESSEPDIIAQAEMDLDKAEPQLAIIVTKLSVKEQALGIQDRVNLHALANSPYIRLLVNSRALKRRLRDRLRAHKFERTPVERSARKQKNDNKLKQHTADAIKRRQPGIITVAAKYNKNVAEMHSLIRKKRAPRGAVAPDRIELDTLFGLDVDDNIWQDVGLDDPNSDLVPPPWLADIAVRAAIPALLEQDRCEEEMIRVMHERNTMQEWFAEEWEVLCLTLESTDDVSVHYALQCRKAVLSRLCAIWQKDTRSVSGPSANVRPWGVSSAELLKNVIHRAGEMVNDEGEDDDDGFDVDDNADVELLQTIDALGMADAYREGELEDDDGVGEE